jgi:large subunit ribosomal protein L1
MSKSKRLTDLSTKVDIEKLYPIEEALTLAKEMATTKFDETVEVHVRLGIDSKKGDQQVRGTVVLPNTFGKAKRVAAFVPESREQEAKDAGADVIYNEETLAKLKKTGKIDFDIAVSVPEFMRTLAPLARMLGTKGLMPSPKNETIAQDLAKTIGELKKGKIAFKNDDTANIHQAIGKASTDSDKLIANFEAFIEELRKSKPESSKGIFLKSVTLCTTMGPSMKLELK